VPKESDGKITELSGEMGQKFECLNSKSMVILVIEEV
jgi:hypothetical protein